MKNWPLALALIAALGVSAYASAAPVPETSGPYKVTMEYAPAHPEHTVYRPADLGAIKGKLPFVAFGNGGCLSIGNLEPRFLAEVASQGFIVTAPGKIENMPENFGPTNTGGIAVTFTKPGQIGRAIDWAIGTANSTVWNGRVDPQRIATMGASCGGLEAVMGGADPRVKTVVVFNSGVIRNMPANMPSTPAGAAPRPGPQMTATVDDLAKLRTPVIYLIGGPKDIAYPNAEKDFAEIQNVPLFNANIDAGHAGTMGQPHGGAMGAVAIDWLKWQLNGDQAAAKTFVGVDCRLCKDSAWTVKKKNMK